MKVIIRILCVVVVNMVFFGVARADVPTHFGINQIQRSAVDTLSNNSAGNWCDDPAECEFDGVYVDSNGYSYYYYGHNSSSVTILTDQADTVVAPYRNPFYHIPQPIPTDANGFSLYYIWGIGATTTQSVNTPKNSVDGSSSIFSEWDDANGQEYNISISASTFLNATNTEVYSFGGETYVLTHWPDSGLHSTTTEGYLKAPLASFTESSEGEVRLFAVIYTAGDLMVINSSNDLKAYMDALFELTAGGGDQGSSNINTGIRTVYSPVNGGLESDTLVTFDFDYWMNDAQTPTITTVGVEVRDITGSFQYVPVEEEIIASGLSNYEHDLEVATGHLHMWRPYMRNATSTQFIYGQWRNFDVVTRSASSSEYGYDSDGFFGGGFPFGSVGTSSIIGVNGFCESRFGADSGSLLGRTFGYGICSGFAFLFIPSQGTLNKFAGLPDLMRTRFPFSYIADFQLLKDEMTNAVYGGDRTLGITVLAGTGTTSLQIFDLNAVGALSHMSSLKSYLAYGMYFIFALFVFRKVSKLIG